MTLQLPLRHSHPFEVAPELLARPVHRVRTAVGHDAWLVTGYAQVRALLTDDRLGRSHPAPDTAARSGDSALFGGPLGNYDTERTDHARMRALLQPHFSARHMRALRPRVEALTTELLDELTPPADLHTALALPLPLLVICELLGVPYDDRARFRAWTDAVADTGDRARSEQGMSELYQYCLELVSRKRSDPGDDVISRLCATDGVSDPEAAGLTLAVLFAGHETTVVHIGLGALLLLTNPARRQAVLDNPDLLPNTVEELLRAQGAVGTGIPRYARTDLEVDGVAIPAGALVLLDTNAANHDPAVFPDHIDVVTAHPHLAFGHGPRYCVGAPLARVELRAVFSQLIPRFPTMRLAVPMADLDFRHGTLTGGLTGLPVTW
ncbi:cytochrome P450 [Actinokineospora sp. 24-640]